MGSLCGFFTASLMVIYVEKAIAAVRPHIAMHSLTHSLTYIHAYMLMHALACDKFGIKTRYEHLPSQVVRCLGTKGLGEQIVVRQEGIVCKREIDYLNKINMWVFNVAQIQHEDIKKTASSAVHFLSRWRRERDSNPRYNFLVVCSLSRGVPSASRSSLRNGVRALSGFQLSLSSI